MPVSYTGSTALSKSGVDKATTDAIRSNKSNENRQGKGEPYWKGSSSHPIEECN